MGANSVSYLIPYGFPRRTSCFAVIVSSATKGLVAVVACTTIIAMANGLISVVIIAVAIVSVVIITVAIVSVVIIAVAIVSVVIIAVAMIPVAMIPVAIISVAFMTVTISVVTSVKSVSHAGRFMTYSRSMTKIPAAVPRAMPIVMPAMPAIVNEDKVWPTKIEVVTTGITCVDGKVPVASVPVQRTIKIASCAESTILPVEQYIAQVEIASSPIVAI